MKNLLHITCKRKGITVCDTLFLPLVIQSFDYLLTQANEYFFAQIAPTKLGYQMFKGSPLSQSWSLLSINESPLIFRTCKNLQS